MKYERYDKLILISGVIFIIAYSITYILINSYIIGSTRYFSLFDDAMISMRYAENIANGFGPIWNIGEPAVEGFSNPLWVYFMALIHYLPLAKPYLSLAIQIIAVIILIINLSYIRKIASLVTNNQILINSVILITALYLPLLNWALQGLEVSIITLLLSLSIFLNLRNLKLNKFSIVQIILPAIMILIRMDTFLYYVVIVSYIYFEYSTQQRKVLFQSILVFGITFLILFSWRQYYFGEWLPNTYYLKMTGYPVFERYAKGLYVFLKFVLYITPILFVAPFFYYFKTKDSKALLLLSLFSIMIIYTIYIGGDSWEWWLPANRFITPAIPFFILLTLIGLQYILEEYISKLNKNLVLILLSILTFIAFNFNSYEYLRGEILIEKTFTEKDNRNQTRLALDAKEIMKKDAVAAVAVAGTLPYFLERNCIDLLGKNDKAIARMNVMHDSSDSFLTYNPGHEKWNYSYSIGKLKPDIILHLWNNPISALAYLSKDYIAYELDGNKVFIKRESKNIRWDRVKL